MISRYIPCSTYRLQLNSDFTFKHVHEISSYLEGLGISDVYSSPITRAKKGSKHGYDVAEPNQVNPEIGTYEEFENLTADLQAKRIGWVQDIVPNHMTYSHENNMLVDLFENGQNSRYYSFFDIEWNHPFSSVRQRILTPILGKYYREVLENGELFLSYDQEGFNVNYYESKFPLKMESYSEVLSFRLKKIRNKLGRNNPDMIKYLGILYMLKSLPSAEDIDERYDQIKFIKGMLWELHEGNDQIKVFIDESLKIYNGEKGIPDSYTLLDTLLAEQHFRLAFWKVATQEINFRRFFTVNELISLKMERDETFNRTHSLLLKLHREKIINGFRIDHIDGLYNPMMYLNRLRDRAKNAYIIVEKILELNEKLPNDWPVEGTTGYDFVNYLNGIYCKKGNEEKFNRIYSKYSGVNQPYSEIVAQNKKLFVQKRMAGEVEQLAFIIEAISSKDRYGIDITMHGLKEALEEILTYFPVYRTYVSDYHITDRDRMYIEEVLQKVKRLNRYLDTEFDYIGNLLLLNFGEHFTEDQKQKALDFVMKFQQLTGPLMAKGFEDTTLYVYNRLISLNEVGGNAGKFGVSLDEFHNYNQEKITSWPFSMNTTATHDTKRGEDVRARLNVLSEIPEEWESKLKIWMRLNNVYRNRSDGFPSRNDEYFLYQALIGSYPIKPEKDFIMRVREYLIKAAREAKVHTSWLQPNAEYESAFTTFAEQILNPEINSRFMDDFIPFQQKVAAYGIFNSLSQTLIKLTAPGIPDIYQGSELWDLSFVDPDNRRTVDFNLRTSYLSEIKSADMQKFPESLLREKEDGKIKLFLIHKVLCLRKKCSSLFQQGEYIPLPVNGSKKDHIIAFARKSGSEWVISIAPRFLTSLIDQYELPLGEKIWQDTRIQLPEELKLLNMLTSEEIGSTSMIFIKDVFSSFPIGVLYRT